VISYTPGPGLKDKGNYPFCHFFRLLPNRSSSREVGLICRHSSNTEIIFPVCRLKPNEQSSREVGRIGNLLLMSYDPALRTKEHTLRQPWVSKLFNCHYYTSMYKLHTYVQVCTYLTYKVFVSVITHLIF
jgi:hypothetical protein